MANYNFKKEAVVHIVYGTSKYKIDISDISFSQTFREKSFAVKTLHNQSSFEGSSINEANPAEFSLNTPLLSEERHKVVFDRLLDCATFDLYISSGQDVYKLEKCVIQDGTFEINRLRPLRLSISGEASKLSKYTPSGASIAATAMTGKYVYITSLGNTDFTSAGAAENKVGHIFTATQNLCGTGTVVEVIPGTLQTAGTSSTTYIVPKISLTLGGVNIADAVSALGVEIQIRHLGFAGANSSAVTGFYGRTGNVGLTSTDHITTGDISARNIVATGIATFGSSSTVIDGDANTIKVGTALTLGHTQGLQFHTQNLHSAGFEINQINASGIITASQFSGDGSNLTGVTQSDTPLASSSASTIFYESDDETTISTDTTLSRSSSNSGVIYTKFQQVVVAPTKSLIVDAGETFVVDAYGLRTPDI